MSTVAHGMEMDIAFLYTQSSSVYCTGVRWSMIFWVLYIYIFWVRLFLQIVSFKKVCTKVRFFSPPGYTASLSAPHYLHVGVFSDWLGILQGLIL